MIKLIEQFIKETIQGGIGQTIIAFGSWGYVIIVFLITIYYAFSSIIKSSNK
ncbi:hypothetical protein [Clostridium magnum]|uniref:Uncharacterized protein n=1 Tax=Clostridium magnum DSM 2767 TaxID=1121326 RepID=A0A162SNC9_9CLOT|nr:hypothetical protein [Clostridium magnum]KZL91657.1 hypothetical protein CLMAG_34160 [Clostridium magnum DSM 2767]SHH51311.1 hypothetical protein SAMN02745944_00855 [Clostridium magnum DSM 2767]